MKKRLLPLVTTMMLALTIIPVGTVYSQQQNPDTAVRINGRILPKSTYTGFPIIQDDRTFVPLRLVTEGMGLDVEWFGDTQDIHLNGTGVGSVWHRVGSLEATSSRGGGVVLASIDSASHIDSSNNRTMVSVRLISEAFGAVVDWHPNQVVNGNTVNIVDIRTPNHRWTNAEDFYDIVERHADGTLTVRTDSGELVRIMLGGIHHLAHHAGTDFVTGVRIGFSTMVDSGGSPVRNPDARDGDIISGYGMSANRVHGAGISGLGGIVRVEQIDGSGNTLRNLGHFMVDSQSHIIDLPVGEYRFTLVESPHGFTNQSFLSIPNNLDSQGRPVVTTSITHGAVRGGAFHLIAE